MLVHEKFSEPLEKNKIYKCPMCHEEVKGRRGLTMHLKRKHFKRNVGVQKLASPVGKKDWSRKRFDPKVELKIQELVLKTVYGMSKVNSVISDYIAGKYSKKTLPINIAYYITLKGITQDKDHDEERQKSDNVQKDLDQKPSSEPKEVKHATAEDLEDALMDVSKSEDIDDIAIGVQYNVDQFGYVSDLTYDISEKVMKVSTTSSKEDSLNESEAIHYLTEYDEDLDNSEFDLTVESKPVTNVWKKIKENKAWIILDLFIES